LSVCAACQQHHRKCGDSARRFAKRVHDAPPHGRVAGITDSSRRAL
jgi:hypothetical protein